MIFREIEIKSAGGSYKLNVTVNCLDLFPIDRTPTGFVHIYIVGRDIHAASHTYDDTRPTGGST